MMSVAGVSWCVCTHNIDDGLMFEAIRELKKEAEMWRLTYIEHRSPVDDNDPDMGMCASIPVYSVDDLLLVLALFRKATAATPFITCRVENPSISAHASLGRSSELHASIDQKHDTDNHAATVIDEIEAKLAQLRSFVLVADGNNK